MFERLARTIDRADLIEDVRFITNEARVQNCETLNAILADYFASASLEENLAKMEAAGVTVAPVFTAGDLINHPYAVGPGLFDL
ncbi:MAG: CoA transferase, partial [Chloroflexota bacterium]